MFKKSILVLAFTLPFVYSCKKEGCTDSAALNYSTSAKKDDGSCITQDDISNSGAQNLYVESFNLTFSNSTSMGYHVPTFNYQAGDMIIIETVNEYGEWTSLPYTFGIDVHIEGSYTDGGTVWIYLKNDNGTAYYPAGSTTVTFRAGLIKKNGLILNPDLKDMTISEIESL